VPGRSRLEPLTQESSRASRSVRCDLLQKAGPAVTIPRKQRDQHVRKVAASDSAVSGAQRSMRMRVGAYVSFTAEYSPDSSYQPV